jgi:hypothetical protein
VHPGPPIALQAQLIVNAPGDPYEREADRISEQVLRMPEPRLQRACACGGTCPKCKAKQREPENERLQTKRLPDGATGESVAPPIVHEVLATPGQSLDPATRGFMESRFGHDLSRIRVHADSRAAESARAVEALAYTVGKDVVFGAGQYAPHSPAGRKLLAHELTHTLQQGASTAPALQRQPQPALPPAADPERCPRGEMRLGPGLPCFPVTLPGHDCPIGQVRLSKDLPCVPLHERPNPLGGRLHLDPITLPGAPVSGGKTPPATGCRYTVTYSNPQQLDCDTIWRNFKGTDPPVPLCGGGLVYDVVSVGASGTGCPATLEGLDVSETVTGNGGCTPPNYQWPAPNPCRIGPGGKVAPGCTDTFSVCGATRDLQSSGCTEIVDQDVLVGGKVVENHQIIFDLTKIGQKCTAKVTRK